nr:hypothetical protein [uncultured Allomuricauda sp.]
MKNQIPLLIAVTGLVVLLAILILQDDNQVANVHCSSCNEPHTQQVCALVPVPVSLIGDDSSSKVMHYYKIDDNCNFQTLQFDASTEYPYANLGRFNGEFLPNGKYRINRMEVKSYNLKTDERKYKISQVSLDKESSSDQVKFNIKMVAVEGNEDPNKVDYIYGEDPEDEQPVILNRNASIEFYVMPSVDEELIFTGGGYECNGKGTTGGGGNQ